MYDMDQLKGYQVIADAAAIAEIAASPEVFGHPSTFQYYHTQKFMDVGDELEH
jgi:hypothetical protein